jgi:hypothetical protein
MSISIDIKYDSKGVFGFCCFILFLFFLDTLLDNEFLHRMAIKTLIAKVAMSLLPIVTNRDFVLAIAIVVALWDDSLPLEIELMFIVHGFLQKRDVLLLIFRGVKVTQSANPLHRDGDVWKVGRGDGFDSPRIIDSILLDDLLSEADIVHLDVETGVILLTFFAFITGTKPIVDVGVWQEPHIFE